MAISILQEPGSRMIGRFSVPFRGTWKTLPPHLLPNDVLADSLNITIQSGSIKPRSGLQRFSQSSFAQDVKGSFLYVSENNIKIPIAVTDNKFYIYLNDWEDRTGSTNFSLGYNSRVRMTNFASRATFHVVIANGTSNLYTWQSGPINRLVPNVGSLVDNMTDIIVAFGRLVVLAPPYTVIWSETYDSQTWFPLNTAILMDTSDPAIALKNLGVYGFVVYKEASITTAFAQAASSAAAFKFEPAKEYEGPCSSAGVVGANGVHFGLTPSGRIFRFDGSNHTFIADGIWPFLRDDIDISRRHMVHGCYNYKSNEIYFWYPKKSQPNEVKGMIILVLPYPLSGVQDFSYFLGESAFSCTDSLGALHLTDNIGNLVFGKSQSFVIEPNWPYDDSSRIPVALEPGLIGYSQEMGQNLPIYKPSYELYVKKAENKKTIFFQSATSNQLEERTLSEEEEIDLSDIKPNEFIAFDNSGSFVGLKVTGFADSGFEYLGCDVYGREIG